MADKFINIMKRDRYILISNLLLSQLLAVYVISKDLSKSLNSSIDMILGGVSVADKERSKSFLEYVIQGYGLSISATIFSISVLVFYGLKKPYKETLYNFFRIFLILSFIFLLLDISRTIMNDRNLGVIIGYLLNLPFMILLFPYLKNKKLKAWSRKKEEDLPDLSGIED